MARRKASAQTSGSSATGSAQDQSSGKENAKWTADDEKIFVGFLTDHLAERGDGNYKMSTFNAAAVVLEERRTVGGPKTGTSCKNKWTRVRQCSRLHLYVIVLTNST